MASFPCLDCGNEVRPRQHAVECDWCHRWQHRKCGTGISQTVYREAMRLGSCDYVCRPCRDGEANLLSEPEMPSLERSVPVVTEGGHMEMPDQEMPTLERSVPGDDMPLLDETNMLPEPEMPSLERSVPVVTEGGDIEMTDQEMPTLERSVPGDDTPLLDLTIIGTHIMHDQIADLDSEPVPVGDSTAADVDSFEFDNEEFDVTAAIPEVRPIVEDSYVDCLSETVLEDRGVVYTLIEGGSQQQTRTLVSNLGYGYTVKTQNRSSTTWRCTSRSKAVRCPVTVLQKDGHFVQRREHVHPAVPDRELRQRIYAKVRSSAKQNVFRPARTIAERVLSEETGPEDVLRPQSHLLKRAANRARAKFRPKEPETLEFDLDEGFIGADEFLVSDLRVDGQRHFVFSTPFQLGLLKTAKRWYMDGTFKAVGRPFNSGQLFSINAFIEREGHQKQLPLVFALMSRRSQRDYVAVFNTLVDRVGNLAVEGFVADFELAVWNAVREVFPGREMKGCAFHWSQAIWRRVQTEGLSEAYRRRGAIFRYVRSLMALQFLPANHIRGAFTNLQGRASTPATKSLVSYVGRQWIDGTAFTPADWSVFRQEVRTNNDLEGYHNRLNGIGSNLGFYRLVPELRREAEIVQVLVEGGDLRRKSTSRSKAINKALATLWEQYMENAIVTSAFLAAVGNVYGVRT